MKNKNMKIGFGVLLIALLIIGIALIALGFVTETKYSTTITMYEWHTDDAHSTLLNSTFTINLSVSGTLTNHSITESWLNQLSPFHDKLENGDNVFIWTNFTDGMDHIYQSDWNNIPDIVHSGMPDARWEEFLSLSYTQVPELSFVSQIAEIAIGFILVIGSVIAAAVMSKFIINK